MEIMCLENASSGSVEIYTLSEDLTEFCLRLGLGLAVWVKVRVLVGARATVRARVRVGKGGLQGFRGFG